MFNLENNHARHRIDGIHNLRWNQGIWISKDKELEDILRHVLKFLKKYDFKWRFLKDFHIKVKSRNLNKGDELYLKFSISIYQVETHSNKVHYVLDFIWGCGYKVSFLHFLHHLYSDLLENEFVADN